MPDPSSRREVRMTSSTTRGSLLFESNFRYSCSCIADRRPGLLLVRATKLRTVASRCQASGMNNGWSLIRGGGCQYRHSCHGTEQRTLGLCRRPNVCGMAFNRNGEVSQAFVCSKHLHPNTRTFRSRTTIRESDCANPGPSTWRRFEW